MDDPPTSIPANERLATRLHCEEVGFVGLVVPAGSIHAGDHVGGIHEIVLANADPIPGFGAFIALIAIMIAALMAIRKRNQYDERDAP